MKPIDMKTIRVAFENTGYKLYSYLCPFVVAVGDKVIVDSPSNGYVAVTVMEVDVVDKKASKRVVCTIDDSEYKEYLGKQESRAKIMERLHAKRQEMEELAIFRILAETDSEAASLLRELESL